MQEIYNGGWYSANEVSSWPFTHELYSTDGEKLSDSIISDIHLVTTGASAIYLSGLQITDDFISVVLSDTSGIAASITVKQKVTVYKNYVFNTFISGLSGTISFGHGVLLERGSWHFTSGKNLLDSACIRRIDFPVTSISVKGKDKVTGRVILSPGTDLSIEKCTVTLGSTRAAGYTTATAGTSGTGYKISLSSDAEKRSTSSGDQSELLAAYLGPCSMRPENEDCPYITSINGVEPDSNGNIIIKVRSGSVLSLQQVLIPSDSDTSTELETTCGRDTSLYSNMLLLSTSEEFSSYTESTPVRRCGTDLCAEDSDASNDSDDSEDSTTSTNTEDSTWSMTSASRRIKTISVDDNYGVVYTSSTDTLSPAGDGAAYVYFADKSKTRAFAGFTLSDGYECGIIYNLNTDSPGTLSMFKLVGTTLSLGTQTETVTIPSNTRISLELMYTDKFTGTLKVYNASGTVSTEIALSSEKSGLYGLYMKNCQCVMWSEI